MLLGCIAARGYYGRPGGHHGKCMYLNFTCVKKLKNFFVLHFKRHLSDSNKAIKFVYIYDMHLSLFPCHLFE